MWKPGLDAGAEHEPTDGVTSVDDPRRYLGERWIVVDRQIERAGDGLFEGEEAAAPSMDVWRVAWWCRDPGTSIYPAYDGDSLWSGRRTIRSLHDGRQVTPLSVI